MILVKKFNSLPETEKWQTRKSLPYAINCCFVFFKLLAPSPFHIPATITSALLYHQRYARLKGQF